MLTLALSLPGERYPDAAQRRRFYDALIERVTAAADVQAAGLVNVLPFSTYDRRTRFVVDGQERPAAGEEPAAASRIASPEYLRTMQIPLLAGRGFGAADRPESAPVALVNQAFVRRHLAGREAVGSRLRLAPADTSAPWTTVVGVIGDVRHSQLTHAPEPEIYVPLAQASATAMMMLAVRTGSEPTRLVPFVRGEVLSLDPLQPIYRVKPLAAMVRESLLAATTSAWLMGIFGGVALVLAGLGIFSVVSYSVTQQMPEFGLRLALGATPGSVARHVIRQGALLVLSGILLGTTSAYVLSGGMRTLVHGVTPTDPATYAVAAASLGILGCLSLLLPARRAASAGPLTALRRE